MNRNNLTLRQKTKIAQKLPADLEEKVTKFLSFVIKQRRQRNYALTQIGNMDETPIWFDMPSARTVNNKGGKTVLVKTTGHEKARFTVVLACMSDGTRLNPMIVFKRKTVPKENFPPGVVIHAHPKGWMDEEGTKIWIRKVWNKRPGRLTRTKSLLVWDSFSVHLMESIKSILKTDSNTDIAVIPGGLTSVIEPLDVCLNKPFKDKLRQKWTSWMPEGEKTFTAGGNMRAASLPVVAEWVNSSWNEVGNDMVEKSFKKCGISNAMGGTEDDLIYDADVFDRASDGDASDNDELYDDTINMEEMRDLFDESEEEEVFLGIDNED